MKKLPRVLFLLKKRATSYGDGPSYGTSLKSSGLSNSARFVHDMLNRQGISSAMVEVFDNNDIDREVTIHRPTHVIIEAFWVVPEKFDILCRLHPTVKWIIRSHSQTPFFAGEGVSIDWFFKYLKHANVTVSFNTPETTDEFRMLYALQNGLFSEKYVASRVVYLPNYYPVAGRSEPYRLNDKFFIDVGCFGAIRPFKNHLIQAVAAIDFATRHGYNLRFHVNGTRVEGRGDPFKKTLVSLFENLPHVELVEHEWLEHSEFVKLVRTMDIGLQVSFTESFNIVAADFVNAGVPIVTSKEISWTSSRFHADTTSSEDIVDKMETALWYKRFVYPWYDPNKSNLRAFSHRSQYLWLDYLI